MGPIKEAKVKIGKRTYVLASDDSYLDYVKRGFEPSMVKLYTAVASDSDVILDVGANIGCTALLFATLAKRVYAFEPAHATFQFLEKNVTRSGLPNIFPQNFGLGAEPGEYPLTFAPVNRSGAYISNHVRASVGHKTERVTIRTLDEVVQSFDIEPVDFIKIDVEGFEGQVLGGARQTLATYRPVVVLELNHWCLNALQRTSIPNFFDFLRSQFPILLAVDGTSYLDLYDEGESYMVMYHHILQMRFPNVLAAFDEGRLRTFRSSYRHQFFP